MSVSFYPFHSLPLKLPNNGMNFSFPLLKLPNKGREEYSKIILFILFHSIPFSQIKALFEGENGMEWKEMKIIILEYSSLSLFGSFNWGNGMGRREHSFFSIPLKPQIFILPEIGRNRIRFNEFFY